MWLTAEYVEEGAVAEAITDLRNAGCDNGTIEIFSAKPVELPRGVLDRPSRASLIAVAAAILNGLLATAFMYYTQRDYPLVTGDMPIVSPWATGVVSYELIMAGAMAGVVVGFLWASGLLRRRRPAPPPLRNGSVFLRLQCSPEAAHDAEERLARSGAVAVGVAEEAR